MFSTHHSKSALVTVLIVNWNSREMLAKCLKYLMVQTLKPVRILVLDNASSDDSADVVKCFENVMLYRANTNLGFAAGNNRILKECDTEFIALLNPDAFPDPDWLESLIMAAMDYPEFAAFGSRQLVQSNPKYLDGIGDNYHLSGLVWRGGHGAQQHPADLKQRKIFSPCAAAALYRREALLEIGGFDEDFFCYLEDIDLGFRLRLAGHQAMYVPDAVVCHVGSATTGGQHSDFAVYHGHRNLVWTFIKNMPGILFWLLLPLHIFMNISAMILISMRGQGRIILKAKRDAIKGLPQACKKRRKIQAKRVATISDIWRVLDKRLLPFFFIKPK